ncbi:Gag-pro-like protein [Senna tora]|uniref:Gag-pro-like protein n=1 Tax=Senna tora TaxID=362788 RepID=A0A834W705_9FABA|nr:Gag-pro-like protein [Senna tora]
MTEFGLGKSVKEEGIPEWKSEGKLSGVWDLEELCVFPQVEIPTGFKIPNFVNKESLRSWHDMVRAFLKQFKHSKIELTRESIQNVSQKTGESFRKYAHRWKQIAIDVQPPMTKQEVCPYFLRSLKDPRYDLMLIVPFEDFSHLITMGEDIDFETQEGHMAPFYWNSTQHYARKGGPR